MRILSLFSLFLACLAILLACTSAKPPEPRTLSLSRGGQVFESYCAKCHLTPDGDAPQLDDEDDWDNRASEWRSLLKDHVKSGFLRMPAKGGQTELSDADIDDVLYYMDVKIKALH